MNPLYEWLKVNDFWITPTTTVKPITHLFMNGGKAHVPDVALSKFYQVYANTLGRGVTQYVVETRAYIFRLFMDLDIRLTGPEMDDVQLRNVCKKLAACVSAHFNNPDTHVVVCTTPVREDGCSHVYKQGVHLYWSNVFLTASKALALRKVCVQGCKEAFGEKMFLNDWEDVIDASVYKGSGIRLIGSSKPKTPAIYMPSYILHKDATVSPVPHPENDLVHWLHATSVRRCDAPQNASPFVDATEEQAEYTMLQIDRHSDDDLQRCNPSMHKDVLEALVKALPKFYESPHIVSLFRTRSKGGKSNYKKELMQETTKYILGTSCRKCLNKRGVPHKSNHIYFVVTAAGVYQKCFNQKDTLEGRVFNTCKNFSSKVLPKIPEVVAIKWFDKPTK